MKYYEKFTGREVEAFKWTGGQDQLEDPIWIVEAIKSGQVTAGETLEIKSSTNSDYTWSAQVGDYAVRNSEGILSTFGCKGFEETYVPLVEIRAGVTKSYKNGSYEAHWCHDIEYSREDDYSGFYIELNGKDFIDIQISDSIGDNYFSIEEANELIKTYGFVIVE